MEVEAFVKSLPFIKRSEGETFSHPEMCSFVVRAIEEWVRQEKA